MSEIHLLCNAHLDPVWQWEWEEGAAAAVSTFRAAADFCEEFDDFVFCHNEVLLYRWIEEYEPSLFSRIQRLVRAGKWHIMGGWYLQPDCNMPGGESIIRQMQLGRAYFSEKFGETNTTAVSFDAFGHSRGLVQLLARAGYDSYLFMRPSAEHIALPGDDFMWVGFDGTEIMAHRINTGYNSALGHAAEKVNVWLAQHPDAQLGLIPWGVGNHGGGPSRKDIADLNALKAEIPEKGLRHSTAEEYFAALRPKKAALPRFDRGLNPWAVGCYTSQIRVKQQHRALEGMLNQTERMLAHAALAGLVEYPRSDLDEAARDLCMSEFHDILPGSSIQSVEDAALRTLSHGQEIVSRLRARAFFALAAGQKPAAPGEIPILVYNPFPFSITQDVECEFMLADQNWKEEFTDIAVYQGETRLPSQVEKERSNLPLDWRKRVVFRAELAPMQMNRFDCRLNVLPAKPVPACPDAGGRYVFDNSRLHVEIDKSSGLMTSYRVDGREYLSDDALKLLVVRDCEDPWGMNVHSFRDVIGEFSLMDAQESARFSGVASRELAPIRVIEDGPVRTVIEACFKYQNSCAVLRYRLPKDGCGLDMEVRLLFAEKDRMVKLSIPTNLNGKYLGQTIFGTDRLFTNGDECVAQQWTAAEADGHMLTLINDGVYGSDFSDGEIRMSLLRGAAYTAHPIYDRRILPQDRFSPRIDQGERLYHFVIEGGVTSERMTKVSNEAQTVNEPPYALSFFPCDTDGRHTVGATLSGEGVQLTALRPCADGHGYIVRLFESTGIARRARLTVPLCGTDVELELKPFEICTLRIDRDTGAVTAANLLD